MVTLQSGDENCPVPSDVLARLYRANPDLALDMLDDIPEKQRIELALFCYSRAHLRPLGTRIAATCDAERLARIGGVLGQVIAAHCREPDDWRPNRKISLGGTRH